MKFGVRDLFFVCVVGLGILAMGAGLMRTREPVPPQLSVKTALGADVGPIVKAVDASFRARWSAEKMVPAAPADDLTLIRRLSLALSGTVPSLEEIRRFEARPKETRVSDWLDTLLHDRRCTDYLAERFARAFVGTEDGPFLLFRRRRFVAWLSDAILENRPYDAIVRDLIADDGLWTDHPATNFLTVTFDEKTERPDARPAGGAGVAGVPGRAARLRPVPRPPVPALEAGRFPRPGGLLRRRSTPTSAASATARERLPAARPQDEGVRSRRALRAVPPELLPEPESGSPREQLAAWVTDPRNPNFARATVNRVWALLFGRPLAEPVDDLPAAGELHPALTPARRRFRRARLRPAPPDPRSIAATEVVPPRQRRPTAPTEEHEAAWAVFPLTRLRPEQVAGALFQSASLTTLGPQSHWFVRLIAYTGRNDFVRRYGDTGEDEFDARAGTIPQRLLLMNGEIVREQIKDGLLSALVEHRRSGARRPQGRRDRLSDRADPPAHPGGIGPLRRPPGGDHGRRAEASAQRPLLDADQYDRVLVEPLRIVDDLAHRTDLRPPRLPQAGRAELADARRAAAGRPGRADPAAGAVDHPALARTAAPASSRPSTRTPIPGSPAARRPSPPRCKGIQLAEGYEQLADQMGSVALIRSMVSKEGDHERGTYLMKTGYRPDPTVEHPVDRRHLLPRAAGRAGPTSPATSRS